MHLQDGVLSSEQARGLGISRHVVARLVGTGQWRRLAYGLYLTQSGAPSWSALAWGGVLLGGAHAQLAGAAAGFLHGLIPTEPQPIPVLVPAGHLVRIAGPWTFVRDASGNATARGRGNPPRTGVERTVLDLAEGGTPGEVIGLVTTAVQQRRTTPRRLADALADRHRHRYRKLLVDLLQDVSEGAESPLEVHYLRDVERAHDLPTGSRQQSRFNQPYRNDVGYDPYRLLVELDGRRGHSDAWELFRDLRRDNRFATEYLITLRYGWHDVVERPCLVAGQVWLALSRGGYDQPLGRCRRCRNVPESKLLRG